MTVNYMNDGGVGKGGSVDPGMIGKRGRRIFAPFPVLVDMVRAMTVLMALLCTWPLHGARAAEAVWITHPDLQAKVATVLHLRNSVDLAGVPETLWIDVSADPRFILYVNGRRAAAGPATSDLKHWRYKRVDIAPFLRQGHNDVGVVVWNLVHSSGPLAQVGAQTAFYLRAEDSAFEMLNSGPQWQGRIDAGHTSIAAVKQLWRHLKDAFYAASNPEVITAADADWGWETGPLAPAGWKDSVPVIEANATVPWTLTPDPLPSMRYEEVEPGHVVRTDMSATTVFPAQPVTIPANSHVKILLARPAMVAAYPSLTVSGGADAKIKLLYAEALYDAQGRKADRAEVGTRVPRGIYDTFIADGERRKFESLDWRVWRFLELEVETQGAPLTLEKLTVFETGYPFRQVAKFVSDDVQLNRIWNIGWRTATIDAHETYMDSAYWERLQYVGDTRLQALISYAVTGDDRLAVNAIDAIGWSNVDGLTEGAYPSRTSNLIAPFSLIWIGMLDDYYRYNPNPAVVTRNLPRARQVLKWYAKYLRPSHILGKTPTWNFVDWVGQSGQDRDVFPSYDQQGESCLTTLFYLGALQQMARLESALGDRNLGAADADKARAISAAVRARCWSAERGLFADDPSLTKFSQHSNSLAILYGVTHGLEARQILSRITRNTGIDAPEGITQTSYYFSWYLAQAFAHAGQADRYLALLSTWRDLLKLNYTTWPEERGNTRSDSHAWSAHPTADLLGFVAGIRPDAPGYARILIAPHLGSLTALDVTAATPSGPVRVRYGVSKRSVSTTIWKPAGLRGVFRWKGKDYPLTKTRTTFRLPR
ncbi:hypothetical protein FHW83_003354 [Duganella sp. SG902]|uniref:alpha-L-rhamnosidase-related protein n=1 Tax=Duganella sp. SG902 TaxID=2587016 RepID=UPI00159E09D6|nr:alpha-L-rhamnosidase C-terminal domain-containing protein [Duganella sp. SG902]NVM77536.1 hypothetical protein [Duganella sp. SG902]